MSGPAAGMGSAPYSVPTGLTPVPSHDNEFVSMAGGESVACGVATDNEVHCKDNAPLGRPSGALCVRIRSQSKMRSSTMRSATIWVGVSSDFARSKIAHRASYSPVTCSVAFAASYPPGLYSIATLMSPPALMA